MHHALLRLTAKYFSHFLLAVRCAMCIVDTSQEEESFYLLLSSVHVLWLWSVLFTVPLKRTIFTTVSYFKSFICHSYSFFAQSISFYDTTSNGIRFFISTTFFPKTFTTSGKLRRYFAKKNWLIEPLFM